MLVPGALVNTYSNTCFKIGSDTMYCHVVCTALPYAYYVWGNCVLSLTPSIACSGTVVSLTRLGRPACAA